MLDIYDWAGCIGFAVLGYLFSRKQGYNRLISACNSVLTAFGGGALLRDMFVINETPFILNFPVQIISVLLITGTLWLLDSLSEKLEWKTFNIKWENLKFLQKCGLILLDSLGVIAFIHIGIRQANAAGGGLTPTLIICSGFITAAGGGCVCSFLLKKIVKAFSNKTRQSQYKATFNYHYCIYAGIIALLYNVFSYIGFNGSALFLIITPFAVIGGFIAEADIRNEVIAFINERKKIKPVKNLISELIETNILPKTYTKKDLNRIVGYLAENKYLLEPQLNKIA